MLLAHYGLGQTAQTLSQIGAGLGLTAERARQIELDALKKLRAIAHATRGRRDEADLKPGVDGLLAVLRHSQT